MRGPVPAVSGPDRAGISPETGELHEVGALYVDGLEYTTWNEAAEREQHLTVAVGTLLAGRPGAGVHAARRRGGRAHRRRAGRPAGQLVRRWAALDGAIAAARGAGRRAVPGAPAADPAGEPVPRRTRLATRDDGLRHALIAAHLLIGVPGGWFLSMTDPPEWAAAAVAQCENAGTWPVLAGPADCHDLLLSSPVILYDHPEIAAESAGDLFDATEIDEILTLRTLALTDAEKREARATDSRAADLLDRLDDLPPEMLDRMHGAIRYLRSVPGRRAARRQRRRSEPPVLRRPPDTPVVGPGRGHLGLAGHRSCHGRRRPGGARQPGADAARLPPGRRPGPVPDRPRGARSRPSCTTWTARSTWP